MISLETQFSACEEGDLQSRKEYARVGGDIEGVSMGVEGPSTFERHSRPSAEEHDSCELGEEEKEDWENMCLFASSILRIETGFQGKRLGMGQAVFFCLRRTLAFPHNIFSLGCRY